MSAADPPEGDPLAVDGKITIGSITLADPHELTLHTAFLAGKWIECVHLKMPFVGGLTGPHLIT
ncbi:hypothetical protein GCM10007159_38920 [Modicisalibacter luteus]|nr:hypothetical protein GCM10007159_38920 [Halomonas lutea]